MYSNKIASTAVQGQYLSSGKKLRGCGAIQWTVIYKEQAVNQAYSKLREEMKVFAFFLLGTYFIESILLSLH